MEMNGKNLQCKTLHVQGSLPDPVNPMQYDEACSGTDKRIV